ncbi:hypothetical protein QYE76_010398 [Lolium multiflorum]|uniref:Transposase (putative) gypsy type domain-containing protein n=1 Tax=Lolium multiflorum TaxID=4521 RepID=A0AAD8TUW9_LOLMU|nr:hypothetical protein QYE76_010398 [Lolium multiflorum]
MGKKRTTASSSAAASAAKAKESTASRKAGAAANLYWAASTVSKRDENKLRPLGLISSVESDFVHPGSASRPKPLKGFILWQLTSNSILHLSIFITVCEAFLGINPHWGLWRKIFYVKRHNGCEGPHVVGGVGFIVRKEVNYFNFPMRESVQGWRQKWFYLRDRPASGHRSNLPPFKDILERRVQPVMSTSHPLWKCTGTDDQTRINEADFMESELRDKVRRLTCFSQKDIIATTSAHPPFGLNRLPSKRCFSDEVPEDDALLASRRRRRINEDSMETAESSPSGCNDDDANVSPSPAPSPEASAPPAPKRSSGFLAEEEDLMSLSFGEDEDAPPLKKTKTNSDNPQSMKESTPLSAEDEPAAPLPPRKVVAKVEASLVAPLASASIPPS